MSDIMAFLRGGTFNSYPPVELVVVVVLLVVGVMLGSADLSGGFSLILSTFCRNLLSGRVKSAGRPVAIMVTESNWILFF